MTSDATATVLAMQTREITRLRTLHEAKDTHIGRLKHALREALEMCEGEVDERRVQELRLMWLGGKT